MKSKKSLNRVEESLADIESEAEIFLSEDTVPEGFLPEIEVEDDFEMTTLDVPQVDGTELENFETAQIEELEFVEEEKLESIVESILFASDRPVSLASIQHVFKGTNIKKDKIKRALDTLAVEYAGGRRGVSLEEITGGYQLRTKLDNMNFLKRTLKTRVFKLSGPALETLSIVAYKQPVIKMEIDQIRGVESGHLLRALMEKGLVCFEAKAEHLPGKPMQYGTTRRFLEIFGLRNIKELPTLSQIDELLPEGIGEDVEEKTTLSMVSENLAEQVKDMSYSQGEEELGKIEEELTSISTSSAFFEQEKLRQKMKRDEEKAQDIRDAMAVGEQVSKRDLNWLKKYEEMLAAPNIGSATDQVSDENEALNTDESLDRGVDISTLDFEEDAHIEDEIPFLSEADDESTEEGLV